MTTITLPDDVPLDQALDLVLRHGLRYDHAARRLLPRLPHPGAGRQTLPTQPTSGHEPVGPSGLSDQHRPAPVSEGAA